MTSAIIAIFAGLMLGCVSSGVVDCYLLLSRSYRKLNNRFVIHFGQLLAVISVGGGLFLLLFLSDGLGIQRRSSPYYSSLYAYAIGCVCVMFFAARKEIRWRKSSGPDRKNSSIDGKQQAPIGSVSSRRLVGILVLGLFCVGFAWAFLPLWPRPVSIILGGISWVCLFGVLVLLTVAGNKAYKLQLQRFLLVAFGCAEIPILGLAWKYRETAPALSSASLITAVLLCLGATTALFIMRRIMPQS